MSKELRINSLQSMSLDSIIESYRNGYRIEGMAACSYSTIAPGAQRTIRVTPSGGTPPYTLQFLENNVVKNSTTLSTASEWSFQHTFPSTPNVAYSYTAKVTDACGGVGNSTTNKVMTDGPCTVTISGTSSGYGCYNGSCVQGYGDQPAGCPTQPCTTTSTGCTNCPTDKNICIMGQCIPKNYALYAGVGFAALMLLK